MVVFFKQKTAYELRISDWSSDVCSSDLRIAGRSDMSPERQIQLLVALGHSYLNTNGLLPAMNTAFGHALALAQTYGDRKRVVSGKSVSVRVDLGGRRIIKKIRITMRRHR